MKFASIVIVVSLVLFAGAPCTARAAATTPATSPATTNQTPAQAQVGIPQSVFVIPTNPKEGRNPFFPNSTFGAPVPAQVSLPTTSTDVSSFVLNGITSPPKRTAMINGRTFEIGEEGEVRLPSGAKELIKCVDIGPDSALISVKGHSLLLHFRSAQ